MVLVLRPAVWIVADKEVQVAIMVQISKHSRPRVDHRLTKVGRVVRVNLGEVGVPVVQKQFGRCARVRSGARSILIAGPSVEQVEVTVIVHIAHDDLVVSATLTASGSKQLP